MQSADVKSQETTTRVVIDASKISEEEFDRSFRPKGAITFFLLLVALGMVIWFGIYFLMLERV